VSVVEGVIGMLGMFKGGSKSMLGHEEVIRKDFGY
jgi:hypothetical protein